MKRATLKAISVAAMVLASLGSAFPQVAYFRLPSTDAGSNVTPPASDPPAVPLTISAYQDFLPNASGTAYAEYGYSGGVPPYTISVSSLPPGLGENDYPGQGTVVFQGTPTQLGFNPPFSVTVHDSAGNVAVAVTSPFTATAPSPQPLSVKAGPGFVTNVLVGTKNSATFHVSGGTPPYKNVTLSPPLPGFTASTPSQDPTSYMPDYSFTLSGIPEATGSMPATTVSVTDAFGNVGTYATAPFKVLGAPSTPISVNVAPDVPSTTPPNTPVSLTVAYSGGVGPYKQVKVSGLAPGLTVAQQQDASVPGGYGSYSGTVTVSGTPTRTKNPPMTFTVTDSVGNVGTASSQAFSIGDPNAAPVIAVLQYPSALSTTPVPNATSVGYLSVSGGAPPYTATIDPVDGVFTMDPSNLNVPYAFAQIALLDAPVDLTPVPAHTVTVTDSNGVQATYVSSPATPAVPPAFPLSVQPDPDIPSYVHSGQYVTGDYDISGGTPPYVVSLPASSSQPPGLRLGYFGNEANVYGVPTLSGPNVGFTFVVTDAVGNTLTYTTSAFSGEILPLTIQTVSDIPDGVATDETVLASYVVNGGVPPYQGSFGAFAPGIVGTLSNGVVDYEGIPTLLGVNPSMTFSVTDATGAQSTGSTSAFSVDPPAASIPTPYPPMDPPGPPQCGFGCDLVLTDLPSPMSFQADASGNAVVTVSTAASGGKAPYTYTLSDGNGAFGLPSSSDGTFTLKAPVGFYPNVYVTAQDSGGGGCFFCFGENGVTNAVNVVVTGPDNGPPVPNPNPPALQIGTAQPACMTQDDVVSGGQAPYQYEVSSSDGRVSIDTANSLGFPASGFCVTSNNGYGSGTLSIKATDAKGRTVTAKTSETTVPAPMAFEFSAYPYNNAWLPVQTLSGGVSPYTVTSFSPPTGNLIGDTYGVDAHGFSQYTNGILGTSQGPEGHDVVQQCTAYLDQDPSVFECSVRGFDATGAAFNLTSSCGPRACIGEPP